MMRWGSWWRGRHRLHCKDSTIKFTFVGESIGSNVPQDCVIIHTIQQYLDIFSKVMKTRHGAAFLHDQTTLNCETMIHVSKNLPYGRTMFYVMIYLYLSSSGRPLLSKESFRLCIAF